QHDHSGPWEHRHDPHEHVSWGHPFSWLGLALGLSLHTLIDGFALAAAVLAEAHEEHGWALFGLGTFLAVALHKPLDSLTITSLMAAGGWSRQPIQVANVIFALMCPVGALISCAGLAEMSSNNHAALG